MKRYIKTVFMHDHRLMLEKCHKHSALKNVPLKKIVVIAL
ncbi:hypothetical protein Lpp223_2233 [Lacticaseibacillus paracasei subsp. paracasei Lpp223]|nr:hypothetical protein Lpp223_2233 [Lacticaseibacillus paracasei subsp. paracasei Lpp223]